MLKVEQIARLSENSRRKVRLLVDDSQVDFVNVKGLLAGDQVRSGKHRIKLSPATLRTVRTRLEGWVAGHTSGNVHSWSAAQHGGKHRDCVSVEQGDVRIVGFCGRFEPGNQRTQVLVLVHAFKKYKGRFDGGVLNAVSELGDNQSVVRATTTALQAEKEEG